MIAIPNIEKPKECAECFYGLRCKAVPRWLTADSTISSDCPLIEIVTCGECIHRKKNGFCLEHNRYEKDDEGFCSYGERKK